MRLFKIIVFFLAMVLIGLASCRKDTNNSKVSVGSNKMSATIGNKNYDLTITEINKISRGDSVTLIISGITKDSTLKVGIALINQVGIFVKKYYFKGDPFSPDTTLPIVYGGLEHIYNNTDTSYISAGDSSKGWVNVLEYNETTDIQGSYDFTAKNTYDTSKIVEVKGQFYASLVDPQTLIPDLPVSLGSMTCRINNAATNFSVFASNVINYGQYSLIVTATVNQENIILNFVNFKPSVGSKYKIDSTQLNRNNQVTASYINDTTYFVNGSAGTSGEIDIVKMTSKSIQGKFFFTDSVKKNPKKNVKITNGMFNAPFKNN